VRLVGYLRRKWET